METFEIINSCRVCGSEILHDLLSLGNQPLANALKDSPVKDDKRYPLTLSFCPKCSLVQIKETVNKELLFENYIWITGTSSTAQNFAYDFFLKTQRVKKLEQKDLVLEIASNDGTFLKPFIDNNLTAIGVDPARNVAEIANNNGVKTINAFWNENEAKVITAEHGTAKLIFARNVIPHVSDLHEVIAGIRLCLSNDGIGAIEFHYAGNVLEQLQYDSIYHEHLCYFSIKTIEYLLKLFDLYPFHIDLSPISGGAYIIYFAKIEIPLSYDYKRLVEKEIHILANDLNSWKSFAAAGNYHRQKSREILEAISGHTIVGFGASARSSTYLNFCGFNSSDICAIIDNNRMKQGLYSPGTSIPIVSLDFGLKMEPEFIFILAWNFKEEIIKNSREKGYGGHFLLPFPNEPYFIKNNMEV
ncbi:MAG: class I SAM-dependent methyltransferase [Promethearchaeota archaeon]|jgi:hypothetical protein